MEEDFGLDEQSSTFLTLVSNDNQSFEIEKQYCKISDFIWNLVELDSAKKEIPVNVSGKLLEIIVNFIKHYGEEGQQFDRIQAPVPKDFKKCKFILEEKENIFDLPFYTELLESNDIDYMSLVRTVNYLSIQPMLELVCARIANITRDMTKEEEIKFLQISEEDYTEMKKTNDWAKE
jgi:hypothetical protein